MTEPERRHRQDHIGQDPQNAHNTDQAQDEYDGCVQLSTFLQVASAEECQDEGADEGHQEN